MPVPLTPTIRMTLGCAPVTGGGAAPSRMAQDLGAHQREQVVAAPRLAPDGLDDAIGGGDADVAGDQGLLERVDRLDATDPRLGRGRGAGVDAAGPASKAPNSWSLVFWRLDLRRSKKLTLAV